MRRFLGLALVLVCLVTLAACGSSGPGYIIMLPEGSTGTQAATSTAPQSSTTQTQSVPDATPSATTVAATTTAPPKTTLPPETQPPETQPPSTPPETQPPETEPIGTCYVLNKNTKKFHYPTCASVKKIKDKNREDFTGTREALLERGYAPCGNCHP